MVGLRTQQSQMISRWTEREAFRGAAGARYGLVLALGFAAAAWGQDALTLALASASLAGLKLLVGLPLTVLTGLLAGRLAGSTQSITISAVPWAVAGALFGLLAGLTQFDGTNLVGVVEPRVLDALILPGKEALYSAIVPVFFGMLLGGLAGVLQQIAMMMAWERSTSDNRMSWEAWLSLCLGLPLVIFLGLVADEVTNSPLRHSTQVVDEVVQATLAGTARRTSPDRTYDPVLRYQEALSPDYTISLVDVAYKPLRAVYLDVVFTNGFTLRCSVVGNNILNCADVSTTYQAWMDQLVQAGRSEDIAQLQRTGYRLQMEDQVLTWLQAHQERFTGAYEISKDSRRGGWVFMSARFDSGYHVNCRFQGAAPVVLDRCNEKGESK